MLAELSVSWEEHQDVAMAHRPSHSLCQSPLRESPVADGEARSSHGLSLEEVSMPLQMEQSTYTMKKREHG